MGTQVHTAAAVLNAVKILSPLMVASVSVVAHNPPAPTPQFTAAAVNVPGLSPRKVK